MIRFCIIIQVLDAQYYRVYSLIGSYIRSWERPGDLPRVI